MVGPSGAGKSTLFRAIAGLWPYGKGEIAQPAHAKLMLLPQRPYIPIGPLAQAIAYPSDASAFPEAQLRQALADVGLPALAEKLDESDNWQMRLSGGEQQRLAVARALLAKPDWLFLDEATASLDEDSENALYRAIAQALPNTTIVSIGHRSTLKAFHKRQIEVQAHAGGAGDDFRLSAPGTGPALLRCNKRDCVKLVSLSYAGAIFRQGIAKGVTWRTPLNPA